MPSFMTVSMASFDATPSIRVKQASLIMGMRMRLETKPGESFTTTGVLPSRSERSATSAQVASLVASPRTISTSGMTGTGFMKCMPMTRSGRWVTAAISVIEMLEVLLARMVSGGAKASSRWNISRLSGKSSFTASTMSWQWSTASRLVPKWMRSSTAGARSAGHACFFATRSRLFAMPPRARSTNSGFASTSSTSRPAVANVCAIPLPMVPPPTTATFFTVPAGPPVGVVSDVVILPP